MNVTAMTHKHSTPPPSQQLDPLVAAAYGELRRIAHRHMQRERRGHTLQTTALVNEAYLRLRELREIDWQDREHFFTVVAGTMRRVLVDQARARRAEKRGGDALRVTLDQNIAGADASVDLISLDAALKRLSQHDEVQARIVELRYFAGLSIEETAQAMALSLATVKRKWTLARTRLYSELNAAQ